MNYRVVDFERILYDVQVVDFDWIIFPAQNVSEELCFFAD